MAKNGNGEKLKFLKYSTKTRDSLNYSEKGKQFDLHC